MFSFYLFVYLSVYLPVGLLKGKSVIADETLYPSPTTTGLVTMESNHHSTRLDFI
jgi:hypothetical protein